MTADTPSPAPDPHRTSMLTTRLKPAEMEQLRATADRRGLTLSAHVRALLLPTSPAGQG